MQFNWLTSKAQSRRAGGKGWGSFATAAIAPGETVAAFGGYVVTAAQLAELQLDRQHRSIQIDADLFLAPGEQPEPGDLINHSCEPNCGLVGTQILVAMREIAIGEELSFDYAMCDASDYDEFTCLCGTASCRGVVTGSDWRQPGIQQRYEGWFSPYVARRIAALNASA